MTTSRNRLTVHAGTSMIVLALLHLGVLGWDALAYLPDWMDGRLWTLEHWKAPAVMRAELVRINYAFWTTLGSFALPCVAMGLVLREIGRRGLPVPPGAAWVFFAWSATASAVMEPAGFPLAFIPACLMFASSRRLPRAGL